MFVSSSLLDRNQINSKSFKDFEETTDSSSRSLIHSGIRASLAEYHQKSNQDDAIEILPDNMSRAVAPWTNEAKVSAKKPIGTAELEDLIKTLNDEDQRSSTYSNSRSFTPSMLYNSNDLNNTKTESQNPYLEGCPENVESSANSIKKRSVSFETTTIANQPSPNASSLKKSPSPKTSSSILVKNNNMTTRKYSWATAIEETSSKKALSNSLHSISNLKHLSQGLPPRPYTNSTSPSVADFKSQDLPLLPRAMHVRSSSADILRSIPVDNVVSPARSLDDVSIIYKEVFDL